MKHKTLDLDQLTEILGERPFEPKSNYKAYLEITRKEKLESA